MATLVTIGEIIKKFRTEGACIKFSPKTILHMADVIGYHKQRSGGKVGYEKSLITAISQRIREAIEYEEGLKEKKPQRASKQLQTKPRELDYVGYNGERDNVDYEWEKNESRKMKRIKININESQLYLITEGNDNEKRARQYIRNSHICDVSDDIAYNDSLVHQLFDYIRNVFCSSDTKSYAYRHIQGITKLILGDGTPNNPGAFKWKKGEIERDKNGMPQLDSKKLFSLRQRVERTAELEANNKMFDNSFRRLDNGAESNFNDFVDAETLPSMSEYMQSLLSKYTEFTTPTDYHILRIPNFSSANVFSQYIPGICYLSHVNSYNEYVGRDGKLFLALKPNCSDIEEIPMKKDLFHNGGRMNEYATSTIGIAATPVENKLGRYILVTVTSRYNFRSGGSNFDYNFQELSNILGFNILDFLHKEFPNERITLNIQNARKGTNPNIKFEQKIWGKRMF
jgi:hypothetical protein